MVKVFAIGDLNIDMHSSVSCPPVFGEEHFAEKFSVTIGGNAANFACALGGLGSDVRLVSVLGSDLYSGFLGSELEKCGVKDALLHSKSQNGISNIMVAGSGERAILSNKGCLLELDSKKVARLLFPKFSRGDIAYFGGFFHLTGMRKGFVGLLKRIRKKGGRVFFDATFDEHGKWEVKSFARLVDVFFLNEVELRKISGKKDEDSGLRRLAGMGFCKVVLKKGPKGAALFSGGEKAVLPAFKGNARDATGAGDFFNAGFVFGCVNGFSDLNCMRLANYVATRKVCMPGFVSTRRKDIMEFVGSQNLIEVEVARDHAEMSRRAAEEIASALEKRGDSVFCLASGKTPGLAYRKIGGLVKAGKADFSKASFLQMDEYIGVSDRGKLLLHDVERHLLSKVNFAQKNVHLMDMSNYAAECRRFDSLSARLGIDFMLLGIGEDGHIAFNEPGARFTQGTHLARLSKATMKINKMHFPAEQKWHAITIGPRQVLSAGRALLLASGRKKSRALYRAVFGGKSESLPASVLQSHRNCRIIADRAAASRILAGAKKFRRRALQAGKILLIQPLDLH